MKKIYEKPSMTVAALCTRQQLMTGSNLGTTATGRLGSYGSEMWSGFYPWDGGTL